MRSTLKGLLGSKEKTQRWLSEETKIRPATISAICNNSIKEIPVSVIERICSALSCQPGDFMQYTEEDL